MSRKNNSSSRWDKRYKTGQFTFRKAPHSFLKKQIGLLPKGTALVLAAGDGHDAVFLAESGFKTQACDISPVALKKARILARHRNVSIDFFEADLERDELGFNKYDVITCFYYLQRDLVPKMKSALKSGGAIVMETFTVENQRLGLPGPRRKEFLLKENELLDLFRDLKVVVYREHVVARRAVASIIACK